MNYEKNGFFYEKEAGLINGVLFNFCLSLSPTPKHTLKLLTLILFGTHGLE
jgi:hypothetical protein